MKGSLPGGRLQPINLCYIIVPNFGKIILNNLPEVSDSKGAAYNDEIILGRSTPLKTFSHSENRTITMDIHLFITDSGNNQQIASGAGVSYVPGDVFTNIKIVRGLESALYPRQDANVGSPFVPPVVCAIQFGRFFADQELCVVLRSMSKKAPVDVPWDDVNLFPYKCDVSLQWDVVYTSSELPGQDRILLIGQ